MNSMVQKKQGFTLIELMVVIGIIGVLATVSMVTFGDAQAKARDGKRISDIKQMAQLIETTAVTSANPDGAITGCVAGKTETCAGDPNISKFVDPSAAVAACDATVAKCAYSIRKSKSANNVAPLYNDFQICFYLEKGSQSLTTGLNSLINSPATGNIDTLVAGCLAA